jgi:hypothetical protein
VCIAVEEPPLSCPVRFWGSFDVPAAGKVGGGFRSGQKAANKAACGYED